MLVHDHAFLEVALGERRVLLAEQAGRSRSRSSVRFEGRIDN
ncbi:MAG: hypothetical protein ACXVR1_06545 [Solirubrobacteraceae bacterium]